MVVGTIKVKEQIIRSKTVGSPDENKKRVRPAGEIDIADGEVILLETKPCFFSFFPFYLPGLYLFGITLFFMMKKASILEWIPLPISQFLGPNTWYIFVGASLIIPALAYSFKKLNLRYLINCVCVFALSIFLKYKVIRQYLVISEETFIFTNAELLMLCFFGLLSLLLNDIFRRSHHYLVTSARIRTSAGIFTRRTRTMPLSKINDLSIDQRFLGKLFRYGTVVPLTASGIGMGSDFAAVSGGGAMKLMGSPTLGLSLTGGHSIQIPKSRTHEALFGIHRPYALNEEIMNILAQREVRLNTPGNPLQDV